ncbi:hypothetical protein DXV75_08645 [Alteromonas aestuariivivens]|uniref:Uncharacterized protein n=1 Tax=Alteromonas aestuariivivens TaxID=1938339 RepID=A0A3D8M8I5_9ALTE|nr:hypothetical protein [Alteromonas aestuariivivens]RDV26134.1 hypothetical protein DXV75_08645 [Alteromonas aestuariivivens]
MSAVETLEKLAIDVNATWEDLTEKQRQEIEMLKASAKVMNLFMTVTDPDSPEEEPVDAPDKES